MNALYYFALFVVVVVIIMALINQMSYKQERITRAETRFRQVFALLAGTLAIILALIAAFFHISILFVLLGCVVLIIVIGVIAFIVLSWASRGQP